MAEALTMAQKHQREGKGGSMAVPAPSPGQKRQKERGTGAVIAPAPDWKHQRGGVWQFWQPESIDSRSLQDCKLNSEKEPIVGGNTRETNERTNPN